MRRSAFCNGGHAKLYWSHLWTHHRAIWYELKRRDGALNPAGDAALLRLKEGLANMAEAGTALAHSRGGEFLSRKLPPAQKETMDRVVAELIVDEDQSFNAASTPGYRRMMAEISLLKLWAYIVSPDHALRREEVIV